MRVTLVRGTSTEATTTDESGGYCFITYGNDQFRFEKAGYRSSVVEDNVADDLPSLCMTSDAPPDGGVDDSGGG